MNPKGWNNEDWDDYEEYLQNLSAKELEIELKLLETLGKAKKEGKPTRNRRNFVKRMKQIQMNIEVLKMIKKETK